jgi:hypothetical protein
MPTPRRVERHAHDSMRHDNAAFCQHTVHCSESNPLCPSARAPIVMLVRCVNARRRVAMHAVVQSTWGSLETSIFGYPEGLRHDRDESSGLRHTCGTARHGQAKPLTPAERVGRYRWPDVKEVHLFRLISFTPGCKGSPPLR